MTISTPSFYYNRNAIVLDNMSFDINNGEIISIVGKSGCGKTTLLKILVGLIHTDSVKMITPFSYLPQKVELLTYLTSFENSILQLELSNNLTDKNIKKVERLFTLFNLEKALNQYPSELSGGMQQRVGLIRALSVSSLLYILDEPFSAVDRNNQIYIYDYLWSEVKEGKSGALLVTHDLEQAISLSDKVIYLGESPTRVVHIQELNSSLRVIQPSERKLDNSFVKELYNCIETFSKLL